MKEFIICELFCNQQTSMTVHLIHARTEPHVWIKLEVIAVIARLGTLEATVKRVNFKLCVSLLFHRVNAKYPLNCTLLRQLERSTKS